MSFRAGTCYLTVLVLLTKFLRQAYAVILYSHQDVVSPVADVEHYILGMGVFFNVGKRFLPYFPERLFNRLWKPFNIRMEVVGDTQPRALGHLTRIATNSAACRFEFQGGRAQVGDRGTQFLHTSAHNLFGRFQFAVAAFRVALAQPLGSL